MNNSETWTPPWDPVGWENNAVRLIDQRKLPGELVIWHCRSVEEVAEAIRTLAVRGAPAIGLAAAYGVVLGASLDGGRSHGRDGALRAADMLETTRPTAVNLFYALKRMREAVDQAPQEHEACIEFLLAEAHRQKSEDLETGRRIAEEGQAVLPKQGPVAVMTHCNAGGLATSGWGTALAPVYAAVQLGRRVAVFANETRPLLQGSRLTAWELSQVGVPVTVMVDSAAATKLREGGVDVVITGADRIAANGDTANKVGTYPLALAAREAGVPFYVAAPMSTFDFDTDSGDSIPIERRRRGELLEEDRPGVAAYNPAFDVTPAELIKGWITEKGILHPPFK